MKQAIYYLMVIGLILGIVPQVYGEYGSIETWNTGSNDIVIHVYDAKTGVDLTGATCTIDILNTAFTPLVNDASMTDSGNGWYNYTYVQMVAGVYNSRIKCTLGTNGSATTSSFKLVDNSLDGLLTGQDTMSALQNKSYTSILNIQSLTELRSARVDDATASTTKFITNLTEGTNNFWDRGVILFTSGGNEGQIRAIKSYNGITKQVVLKTPLTNSPANLDTFSIIGSRKYLLPDEDELFLAISGNHSETIVHGDLNWNTSTSSSVNTSAIADAVWDEIYIGHSVTGSFGKLLRDIYDFLFSWGGF